MPACPPNELNAHTLAVLLHRRELTAEALLVACLERIDAREPEIRAWACLDRTGGLSEARRLDRSPVSGLLHGMPVGIKDIIDTASMPTTYGSVIYRSHRPSRDAAVVALNRSEGAIILGKTVTTEFAVFEPGPTTNPHNPLHTPGGSSSGSAASVADYMVPLALGTQTGGSIIRPAAYCGVVGYKPSFNTIPRAGISALADSLDTVGPLARTVQDAALLAAASSGFHHLLLSELNDERPRIGLCRTWEWAHCDDAQQATLERAAARLTREGFSVIDLPLPERFKSLADAHYRIMLREQHQSLAHERLEHEGALSRSLKDTLAQGAAVTDEEYRSAWNTIRDCQCAFPDLFASVDVLLVPSVTGEAPKGLAYTGNPIMNRIWTALHGPIIALPFGHGPQGLPTSVSVAGVFGRDYQVLRAAQAIEAALAKSLRA